MEWSPACGVLGVPISLQCESQTGLVSCSVTQLFAKIILDIPHALLLPEEQNKSDNNTENPIETKLNVYFSEDAIILKNTDGNIAIEGHPWGTLEPQNCQWHSSIEDRSMRITLIKAPTNLGSWPYSFQSLVLHNNNKVEKLESECTTRLCHYDKKAFNKHADKLLASHIAESRALKSAFAHAIAEQINSISNQPCGPLGQCAFLFPQQGAHCFDFLKTCYHIPSVRKLVRIAHNLTGVVLIEEERKEEKEEEEVISSFYSLRSLVGCLIAGLAAVEQYRLLHGIDSIKSINACIGFGAGEYVAAVFAGALRLQDALVAVKAHAEAFFKEDKHSNAFHNRFYEDDIEERRSRAIDAVRAVLTGTRKQNVAGIIASSNSTKAKESSNSTINTQSTLSSSTGTQKPVEETTQPEKEESTIEVVSLLRSPRLRIYSGADGVVYDNNSTALLNALPYGVCAGHAVVEHRHDVRIALMQQGVAEMTVLVPEQGDEMDDEEETEEEEKVEME